MYEIDLFIFDLDGTLIDSTRDIANAVNHTLGRLGERELPQETIEQNVGDGVLNLLRKCLVENHAQRIEEAVSIFRAFYGNHLLDYTRLYPGVREILDHFAGKKKAILTNKPERFVAPILGGLGLGGSFSYIIGGDGKTVPKPSAEPVRRILRHFDARAAKAVMVGDSPVDIETGRTGDILTCAVTGGYRSRQELAEAKPDYMIDHILGLKDVFC